MSLIEVEVVYGQVTGDGNGNQSAPYSGYGFDTEAREFVDIAGTWVGAVLDSKPADVHTAVGSRLFTECQGTTRLVYNLSGYKAYDVVEELNSIYCGYEAPAPACTLVIGEPVLAGTTATIPTSGALGALSFSLDGGLSTQASNVFANLVVGQTYTVQVTDAGTSNCARTREFTVTAAEVVDPAAPIGAPVSLSLALAPVFETVTGEAASLVQLELLVESEHGAADYTLVYRCQKVIGSDGQASFQLDAILRNHVPVAQPDVQATETYRDTSQVRNYYTRTRLVDADGMLSVATNRPLRTALRSGLAMGASFLTTQPGVRYVRFGQLELLYFLVPASAPASVTVRRTVTLSNGLTGFEEEVVSLPAESRYTLLVVPVFTQGMASNILQLLVQVLSPAGLPLTPAQIYVPNEPPAAQDRAFVFANPVGGLDVLHTSGRGVATLETKIEETEQAPQPGRYGIRTMLDVETERKKRVATGWLTAGELRWLQAFVAARYVWEVKGNTLEPLVLSKRSLSYERDERKLEGLSFEYSYARDEQNWRELR